MKRHYQGSLWAAQADRWPAALLLLIVFFLFSCQPQVVVTDRKPTTPVPISPEVRADLFTKAEAGFTAKNYSQAFQDYSAYLQLNPYGEKSRITLYRMAKIKSELFDYKEALIYYNRLISEYAGHSEIPSVRFEIMEIYYRMADYEAVQAVGREWINANPNHPMKAEAALLLGKASRALGLEANAFQWWLKAMDWIAKGGDISRQKEIEEIILGTIQSANLSTLQNLEKTGKESKFAPYIYQRLANLYLQAGNVEEAKSAAMALIRSSTEQQWVAAGREILESASEKPLVHVNRIGCLLPLSGSFAVFGQEVLNGIQLGLGLTGQKEGELRRIELVIKDTGGDPDLAALQLEEMVKKDKVIAVIGPLASKPATAAARKAQEWGIPIITLTQKEGITQEGDMVFQNFMPPQKEIKTLAEKAIHEMALKRFGILYPDNTYGRSLMNLFWDQVESLGGTITAVEAYNPNETDFAVEIKKMTGLYYPRPESIKQLMKTMKIKTAKPKKPDPKKKPNTGKAQEEEEDPFIDFDAVFVPDSYKKVILIAPQFPFHNVYNIPLLGTSLWQSEELIEMAGEYMQGAVFPSGFFSASDFPMIQEFMRRYEDNFETKPGVLAATGYDTIQFIRNLLQQIPVETRKDFQKALLTYDGYYGLTGKIAFDQKREVVRQPLLVTIKGKYFHVLP